MLHYKHTKWPLNYLGYLCLLFLVCNLFKIPDQNWKNGWSHSANGKWGIHGLCLLYNDCAFKNDVYEHCNFILQIDKKGKTFGGYIFF